MVEKMSAYLSGDVFESLRSTLLLSNRQLYVLVKEQSSEAVRSEVNYSLPEWKEKLRELLQLLKTDNLKAIEFAEQICEDAPLQNLQELETLVKQVNCLEYDEASVTVQNILSFKLSNL